MKTAINEFVKKYLDLLKRYMPSAFRNIPLKLLSFILAIMLCGFVLVSDPNFVSERVLTNLDVTTSYKTQMEARGLSIVDDLDTLMPKVRAKLDVAQSDYFRINNSNVRIELDLSKVKQAGKQTIPFTAQTLYGKVTSINPDSIEVTVEPFEQKQIPVAVEFKSSVGKEFYLANSYANPPLITISGPQSQVSQITNAKAILEFTGAASGIARSVGYSFKNEFDETVSWPTISVSTTSVIVSASVYPTRKIQYDASIEKLITSTPKSGYEVVKVDVMPATTTIAGSQEFLDNLSTLLLQPINVSGLTKTTTIRTKASSMKDIIWNVSEDVDVTVHIAEVLQSRRIPNVSVSTEHLSSDSTAKLSSSKVSVRLTGPYQQVNDINRDDIYVFVDLQGFVPGTYELPLQCLIEDTLDTSYEIDPAVVTVTIK